MSTRRITVAHPDPKRRYELALQGIDPEMKGAWYCIGQHDIGVERTTYVFVPMRKEGSKR